MKWPTAQLGNLCSVITKGTTPRTLGKEYVSEGIPFLRAENLLGDELALGPNTLYIDKETHRLLDRSVIKAEDVLISIAGTIGRCAIVPRNMPVMNCNQAVAIVRIVGPLDRRFFLHWLKTQDAQWQMAGAKVTQTISNLSLGQIKKLIVPLPPFSEQRRIVEILDQADALRKKRTEADVKAARILPALFYKMFGDPATNPRGWSVKKLGDPQVTTVNPKFSSAGVSDNTQFSFLPMADVDEVWGRIIGKQVRSYSDVMRGFTPFQDNDVLFAKITPCMQNGKAAIARNLVNGQGFGSTEFHVLRAGALSTPEWLYGLVRLPWFKKQAESSFTGTVGQQRVPTDFLIRYTIGCPPVELQRKFAKAVRRLQEWVDQTDRSRRYLENIFSVMLHHAFTGDLTTKWREAHMKELMQEMEQQAKSLNLRMES